MGGGEHAGSKWKAHLYAAMPFWISLIACRSGGMVSSATRSRRRAGHACSYCSAAELYLRSGRRSRALGRHESCWQRGSWKRTCHLEQLMQPEGDKGHVGIAEWIGSRRSACRAPPDVRLEGKSMRLAPPQISCPLGPQRHHLPEFVVQLTKNKGKDTRGVSQILVLPRHPVALSDSLN